MSMKEWVNKSLPDVVNRLEKNISSGFHVEAKEGLNLSGRDNICDVLATLLAALFPGAHSREKVSKGEMNFFLGDILRHVSIKLAKLIEEALRYHCLINKCDDCDCEKKAEEACRHLIGALPEIRNVLQEDIQAAYEGDPSAKSPDEIVLSYPCIEAIATYRIAHLLYELEVPIIPRIMSERAHSRTGIDIHPGAKIGPHFFIDHGTGVVIGETCTIGRNVKIYQGVTLGALSFSLDEKGNPIKGVKRHPDIEDDVIIYANATILGGKTVIGKGAVIGGNTWITKSVPPESVIYSNNRNYSGERTVVST